jgi:hypothetical protein
MPSTLTYAIPTPRETAVVLAVILFTTAASPAIALLLAWYGDAFAAVFHLGHFPRPSLDDPKTLPYWTSLPSTLLIPTVFVWPFLLPLIIRRSGNGPAAQFLFSLLLFICAWGALFWDPFGVMSWVMD